MPLVSIIVPVYNEEERIEKCIRSIQDQTLHDLEIIVINDGSTDRSYEILQKLSKSDLRIKVVNCNNGGAAYARNRGLKLAQGNYIGFADADDWMEPTMFASLVDTIKSENTDLVLCDILKVGQASQKCLNIQSTSNLCENLLKDFILFKFDFSLCNKLFKAEVIRRFKIQFDDKLKISQDVLFNLQVFAVIQSISLRPEAFYHYVVKPGSLMSRPQSQRIESFNYVIKAFREFCTKNNLENEWNIFAENIGAGYQQYFLGLMLNSPETKPMSFAVYYNHVLSNLRLMDPLLLHIPQKLTGYQRFRMGLLQKRRFRTFSLFSAIRHKTVF